MKRKKIMTAGYYGSDDLFYSTGISRCGKITNGVAFEHGEQGWWVVAFDDLEKIYFEAKKKRKNRKEKP